MSNHRKFLIGMGLFAFIVGLVYLILGVVNGEMLDTIKGLAFSIIGVVNWTGATVIKAMEREKE